MGKYQELQDKLKALREEKKECGKEMIREGARELFDKYSKLTSFSWKQFTDYFNDGDACNFGVRADDYALSINGHDYEEAEDVGGFNKDELDEISSDISKFVYSIDSEDLKNIFGDHIEVIIRRDGKMETEDYTHHD